MTVSPLLEVERSVQERAKAVSLDMASPEAASRLRALVHEEVERWSEDYKRGRRRFDIADPDVVAERAFRNLAGYGPLEPLLADDDVWEIMVNAPDGTLVESCSPGALLRSLRRLSPWCRGHGLRPRGNGSPASGPLFSLRQARIVGGSTPSRVSRRILG